MTDSKNGCGALAAGGLAAIDDSRTFVEALTEATTNAGYPSTPKPSKSDRQ